jgi:hypothetical protein
MEEEPGTCDLYSQTWLCCHLAGEHSSEPEKAVREAINSFLAGCDRAVAHRPCRALDIGANNGWFSAQMLAHGATVLSVEPQADFAGALNATAQLNCWAERSAVIHAFAFGTSSAEKKKKFRSRSGGSGWRLMGTTEKIKLRLFNAPRPQAVDFDDLVSHELWTRHAPPRDAPPAKPLRLELIKLDGDGPEDGWLKAVLMGLSSGSLSVGAIIVEASKVQPSTMRSFHLLNFTVYRLDANDNRRFITSRGWDGYSPPGSIAPLDRLRKMKRNALEEEMFSVRLMRHVFRVRSGLSLSEWADVLKSVNGYALSFVITRDQLVEASKEDNSFATIQAHRLSLKAVERTAAVRNGTFEPRADGMD